MQMIKSIVGSLKEVFGKTFLLTGVLPAAVVLIAWDWADTGSSLRAVLTNGDNKALEASRVTRRLLGVGLSSFTAPTAWMT